MNTPFPARLRLVAPPDALRERAREAVLVPAEASDDASLIFRMQRGDHEALGLLFDRFSAMVFQIGCQILRDDGEAEELVQDVFLNVYRKCASFDHTRGSVRGWLRRIAYRDAFDRKSYLQSRRFYDSQAVDDAIEQVRSLIDIEREADAHKLESLLRNAIRGLNEKQRTTIELCLFEGYTLREISELRQDSLVNVRHHYYRALAQLRAAIPFRKLRRKSGSLK
jgi:RNA polymerase sigma-70 factor (ECF subfamily)